MSDIAWFRDLNNKDIDIAGGKGASLGEMYNAGFPIPPGFVVTAQAYKKFINQTGIAENIYDILKELDVNDNEQLQSTSKKIQQIIIQTPILPEIKSAIEEAYDALNIDEDVAKSKTAMELIKPGRELPYIAARSSATAEDLPTASFAGQQASYLNIKGSANVVEAVQKCWASLFTARAIYYREKNNFPHEKVFIAVIIQKMINAQKSGVIFSVNPLNNHENEVLIESGWGLGEAVVSGAINPDECIVDKRNNKILSYNVKKQTWYYTLDPNLKKTIKKDIPEDKQESRILTDYEALELAKYAIKSEEHYGNPQDLEYAIEKNKIYIVQSRPITTLKKPEDKTTEETTEKSEEKEDFPDSIPVSESEVILKGIGASPGIGKGKVKIIENVNDLTKIKKGDILVAEMTNPDYVSAMEKSAAIVTDSGGSTSHAAIVGREMGIPVIVGTIEATKKLKEDQFITVDAKAGKVYEGNVQLQEEKKGTQEETTSDECKRVLQTVTDIKIIMDLPKYAEKAAKTGADGVGLLRGEFINLGSKIHPIKMIKSGRKDEFINNLKNNLIAIAKYFEDKPVWYRTLDAPTDEFRQLEGGEDDPREDNPMMGWRSIRRSLDQPELFIAELEAVKKAHDEGYTNIGIMLPLITHVSQIREAKKYLKKVGLEPQENIDFGIMIETPASVWIIDELCQEGLDFVSFGTNDLTQFTLAIDRNSAHVQKWYDEMHPAVLRSIKKVIETCKKYGVETSICGQAGSNQDMAEFLVKAGVDSISANPDAVFKIREIVARAEKKLLLNVARKDFKI